MMPTMVPRLTMIWGVAAIGCGLTACDANTQQALAPDPRLRPSPPITTPSSKIPTKTPETEVEPSSSPIASPTITTTPASPNPSPVSNQELAELSQLGVFSTAETNHPPSKVVSRRDYARWLVAAHNKIHQTHPSQQLKLAAADTIPLFSDVPVTHPDFRAIQSLANAGIIPSTLNGNNTIKSFQPDAPLTREQLVAWKMPLDSRQAAPTTVSTVPKTWGFQDAAKISPAALPSILADYQNGDKSNIRRAFGYTTLLQPQKPVTLAEVVSTIWYFGASNGRSAHDAIQDSVRAASPSSSP
jgi:hypothetical protein